MLRVSLYVLSLTLLVMIIGFNAISPVLLQQPKHKKEINDSIFDFHSGMWINLHHFIYYQALLKDTGNTVNRPVNRDTIDFNGLNKIQRQDWLTAIEYYRKNLISKDLLMDADMETLKNILEDKENDKLLEDTELPVELKSILNSVSDSYKTFYWKQQDQDNKFWIEKIKPLVQMYGDTLIAELQTKYLMRWPEKPIRVDVTNYANWTGAYTSLYPNRITISSIDSRNQKLAALEVLFHEASHIIIDTVRTTLTEICRRSNKLLPKRDLWHAILFYTTGEIIKGHLKQYIPYAYQNELWNRAWPMYINYLDKDWQPYLKGEIPLNIAIARLVTDVGIAK